MILVLVVLRVILSGFLKVEWFLSCIVVWWLLKE